MDRILGRVWVWAMVSVLIASVMPSLMVMQPSFASHSDIEEVTVDDITPGPGDEIVISGFIDGADEDEDVDITIRDPDGGSDAADTQVDNDEEFSVVYEIPDSAEDGIYEIEVEFGSEDPMYAYFLIDEEDDPAPTETDDDTYDQGAEVEVSGNVEDPESGVDDVDIIVLDPEGDDIGPGSSDLDSSDDFEDTFDLDSDAHPGVYAVIVEHDNDEVGWAIFEVVEGSGSSGDDITAQLEDITLSPGDEVVITGSIDETDVDSGEEMNIDVVNEDDDSVFDDSVEPENDGFFMFEFDLEDDADSGIYTVTLSYGDLDVKELTFTVSSTSGGSGGGSGSGSSGGLTARLSELSLLAGESLTVSGVVPSVQEDEPVNISVLRPNGLFVVGAFPEPDSDRSYSATLRLPSSLEEDEDYSVVVSYEGKEVEVFFDITGVVSGSDGGPITVETDRTTYPSGSTVRISGEIASDTFVEGQQVALQVYNADDVLYRFDPITPESDGTYSYSMAVGGPLGVSGEWEVKVTYNGESAETNFDLTGGAPSSPRFNLVVGDLTFPIEYQSDGTVKNMFVRPADDKLVISMEAEGEGTITIVLPRDVIDAIEGGSDVEFIVLTTDLDTGEEQVIEASESSTDDDSRTLVINYPAGTDLIEIQGTVVVPEFGALGAIVLVVAVLSFVTIVARFSRWSGTPRIL